MHLVFGSIESKTFSLSFLEYECGFNRAVVLALNLLLRALVLAFALVFQA